MKTKDLGWFGFECKEDASLCGKVSGVPWTKVRVVHWMKFLCRVIGVWLSRNSEPRFVKNAHSLIQEMQKMLCSWNLRPGEPVNGPWSSLTRSQFRLQFPFPSCSRTRSHAFCWNLPIWNIAFPFRRTKLHFSLNPSLQVSCVLNTKIPDLRTISLPQNWSTACPWQIWYWTTVRGCSLHLWMRLSCVCVPYTKLGSIEERRVCRSFYNLTSLRRDQGFLNEQRRETILQAILSKVMDNQGNPVNVLFSTLWFSSICVVKVIFSDVNVVVVGDHHQTQNLVTQTEQSTSRQILLFTQSCT